VVEVWSTTSTVGIIRVLHGKTRDKLFIIVVFNKLLTFFKGLSHNYDEILTLSYSLFGVIRCKKQDY